VVRPFDPIVCAVDLHPAADRVLPYVAALARGRRVSVELVTVVGDTVPSAPVLAGLERRVERHGLKRSELFVIAAAAPGSAVVEHVSGRDGALLVIASTAHGGCDEHQLGTVTDQVLRRLRQPVLVVGPRSEMSPGALVVVVDDSGFADAAMPVVERWSATFGDRGIHIVEVRAPDRWPEHVDVEPGPRVDRYVAQLGASGLDARGQVIRGLDPVVGVLDRMAHMDVAVVVVASPPDIGQPTHWFSTSRRLIRFSPRPVLVVPVDRHPSWPH
jgi:nucleotide-binding universal stress UspA family protein